MISCLANLIWILTGGLLLSLSWLLLGLLLCITVIGIPFGMQCFKFAKLSFAPFGKKVHINFSAHPIANILWMLLFGWEMFLAYILIGIADCVTIVGIPAGIQAFKFSVLALMPFGADVI